VKKHNTQISRPQEGPRFKYLAQRARILALLRERESTGATNVELNQFCFRYGARLWELRRAGHKIRTKSCGSGVFVFILEPAPSPARGSGIQ
jgi:hypothetical protein